MHHGDTPSLKHAVWLPPLALWFITGTSLYADTGSSQRVEAPHVMVTLLSETDAIQPGVALTVGLHFELENHWHVYWLNPGDSGLEPRVTWHLPDGFEVSPLRWPAPNRIPLQQLVNFGYEGEVVLLAEITPPHDLPLGGKVTLSAAVEWLVCEEVCIAGSARLGLALPVKANQTMNPKTKALFDIYQKRLPAPAIDLGWRTLAQLRGQMLEILFTPRKTHTIPPRAVLFFPDQPGLIDNAGKQTLHRQNNGYVLHVPLQPTSSGQFPDRLQGVLVIDAKHGWGGPGSKPAMRIDTQLKPH